MIEWHIKIQPVRDKQGHRRVYIYEKSPDAGLTFVALFVTSRERAHDFAVRVTGRDVAESD